MRQKPITQKTVIKADNGGGSRRDNAQERTEKLAARE